MKGLGPSILRVAAIFCAGIMLFSGLGSLPLMQPDEGRNAEVAREMAAGGSWLVPTLEGHPYLDKPAAYFAAVAVSIRMLGANEWGARVPSAVCGALILAMVYAFASRWYDPPTAAFAVIVVATSPLVFAFSRIVIMDVALGVCTVAAILASFVAEEGAAPSRRWHGAAAAAVGFGMLVKGPVGALVPAAVLVVFFVLDRRARALLRVFAPWNWVIVAALFVPWFVALCRAHPEFLHYGLVEETFNRFFTPAFNRGQPFWYYGPMLLTSLMPWSVLFVPMIVAAVRARALLSRVDLLFVVWAIVVIVFFSMSRTKQPGYILTAAVAAGVLIGRGLGHASGHPGGRAARLVARATAVWAGFSVIGAGWIGRAVARGAIAPDRLAEMTPEQRAIWAMWPAFVAVLIVIGALGLTAYVRRSAGFAVASFALFPLALVTVLLPAVTGFAAARSAKSLAASLSSIPADTEIACLEGYPAGLSFYLGRTLTMITEAGAPLRSNFIIYWLQKTPARPPTIVAPADRDRWLDSRKTPVTILAPEYTHAGLVQWMGSRAAVVEAPDEFWVASLPRPEAH